MAALECFSVVAAGSQGIAEFFNIVVAVVNLKKCETVSQDVFPNFVAVQDIFLCPKLFL